MKDKESKPRRLDPTNGSRARSCSAQCCTSASGKREPEPRLLPPPSSHTEAHSFRNKPPRSISPAHLPHPRCPPPSTPRYTYFQFLQPNLEIRNAPTQTYVLHYTSLRSRPQRSENAKQKRDHRRSKRRPFRVSDGARNGSRTPGGRFPRRKRSPIASIRIEETISLSPFLAPPTPTPRSLSFPPLDNYLLALRNHPQSNESNFIDEEGSVSKRTRGGQDWSGPLMWWQWGYPDGWWWRKPIETRVHVAVEWVPRHVKRWQPNTKQETSASYWGILRH